MGDGITHDALFTQMGCALHAWTNIETALSEYFMAIHAVARSEISHPLRTVFEAVISFDARLSMIESSIQTDNTIPKEYDKMFASLRNKLSQQYKKRHRLAHFKMAVDWNKDPAEAVIMPFYKMAKHMSQSQKTLSISDIIRTKDTFHQLNMRVNYHADYISRLKGMPTQWPQPEGGLLKAIQGPQD